MAERIVSVTCPNCKHGIKHDTLTGKTSVTPPEEYPTMNDAGRCWCKMDQRGTYPTKEGLCTDCLIKGIETRLRPKNEKNPMGEIKKAVGAIEEDIETIETSGDFTDKSEYDLRDELTVERTETTATAPTTTAAPVKPKLKKKPKVLR